ncbi:unnamed protein product, partial [Prorocentrum cordatum]
VLSSVLASSPKASPPPPAASRPVLPHGLVGDQPVLPRELVGDGLVGDPALPRALVGELVRPRAVLRRRLAARGGEGGLRVRPGGRVLVGPGGHEGAAPAAQALRSMTAQASGVVRFPIPSCVGLLPTSSLLPAVLWKKGADVREAVATQRGYPDGASPSLGGR